MYFEEAENKLAFRDWKVYIDNTSEWFDDINKKLSLCYIDTYLITQVYPQIRTFASSRIANLENFEEIDRKLNQVRDVIYSAKYREMKQNNSSGEWDNKVLIVLDKVIQLLSKGLSEGELTPKSKKETIPYEKTGTSRDTINKALYDTNKTTLSKDGKTTTRN